MSGRDRISWTQIGVGFLIVLSVLPVTLLLSMGIVGQTGSDLIGAVIVAALVGLGRAVRPLARWFWQAHLPAEPERERRFKIRGHGRLCVLSLATTAGVVATSIHLNY